MRNLDVTIFIIIALFEISVNDVSLRIIVSNFEKYGNSNPIARVIDPEFYRTERIVKEACFVMRAILFLILRIQGLKYESRFTITGHTRELAV